MHLTRNILAELVAVLVVIPVTTSAQQLTREECELNIKAELTKLQRGIEAGPYHADWESLKAHNAASESDRPGHGVQFDWDALEPHRN